MWSVTSGYGHVSMVWVIFFFKQKTAYEMRISDWSSDVCSSDLVDQLAEAPPDQVGGFTRASMTGPAARWRPIGRTEEDPMTILSFDARSGESQIGRASCRERVCQYV